MEGMFRKRRFLFKTFGGREINIQKLKTMAKTYIPSVFRQNITKMGN